MKTNQAKEQESATPTESERSSSGSKSMEDSALHSLFLNELKDIYWAEKQLVKNLPGLASRAFSDELREAMEAHLHETVNQVTRLETIFERLNQKASTRKCEAMEGILRETELRVKETKAESLVRDAAIIGCAQKVEHYEIATYGTLRTLAAVMKHDEVEKLLMETLEEEKNADATLSKIAKDFVNEPAKEEAK